MNFNRGRTEVYNSLLSLNTSKNNGGAIASEGANSSNMAVLIADYSTFFNNNAIKGSGDAIYSTYTYLQLIGDVYLNQKIAIKLGTGTITF